MNDFITRHASKITGVLKGFDRLLFRGHLLRLNYAEGVAGFLRRQGVLLKDFGTFVEHMTAMIRDETAGVAASVDRPAKYLESSAVRKEDVARRLLAAHPVKAGLVCVLSCVEPCMTWQVFRSRAAQTQELRRRTAKCLHYYFYFLDPTFGWMHVRVQTWMPYTVQVCLNGREWLANQLDAAGIGYRRADNCFLSLDDVDRAQQIMDDMVTLPWQPILDRFISAANPVLNLITEQAFGGYRWGLHQCEVATDVMFKRPHDLAALYPGLARFAITELGSKDTMRFLGKPLVATYRGEVVTNYKHRPEGICVRHTAGGKSPMASRRPRDSKSRQSVRCPRRSPPAAPGARTQLASPAKGAGSRAPAPAKQDAVASHCPAPESARCWRSAASVATAISPANRSRHPGDRT